MNIENMSKNYINEEKIDDINENIKKIEEQLSKEKEKLHHQEIITDLFLQLLNCIPRKYYPEQIFKVKACLHFSHNKTDGYYTEEDLRYIEKFLNYSEIKYEKKLFGYSNFIYVDIMLTLEEKDKLKQFIINQKDVKILSKIKRL